MLRELIAEEFGLARPVNFLRDPLWWLAATAGLAVAAGLFVLLPAEFAAATPRGAPQWVSIVLWQPAVEEIAFRGLLQGRLLRTRWARTGLMGISAANAVTSVAFTAIHFVHHSPLWAASVFPPSLVFGWLRERHRNTWAPMTMHMLYNLAFFTAAWWAAG